MMGTTSIRKRLKQHRTLWKYCLLVGFGVGVWILIITYKSLYTSISAMKLHFNKSEYGLKSSIGDIPRSHKALMRNLTLSHNSTKRMVFHEMSDNFKKTDDSGKGDDSLRLRRNSSQKNVMTAGYKYKGRLGNQLFRVAALIAIASYHGYIAVIDKALPVNTIFDLPNVSSEHVLNASEFIPKFCCKFDKSVHNLSHQTNWTLEGQFQSWKYIEGSEDVVKRAFKIKENFCRAAATLINMTIVSQTVKIAIHVRRGDFFRLKKQGFSVAPVEYIKKAAAHFRNKYKLVHFFVVSDDKHWCKNHLAWPDFTISPFSTVGHDMALMIQCDHVIVTSGTFGWWGAWLAGGETVYWTGFPSNGSRLASATSLTDYYPSHWIGLS